ncbi:MAG: class I SAM-dependent methyltransferase [Planctomycetota bacterium]
MLTSIVSTTQKLASLKPGARVLLVTPGPHGEQLLTELVSALSQHPCVVLESSVERLKKISGAKNVRCVRGKGTRLPFARHSFDAVFSFEALYSIRPPWTALAEFHRVLVPNGTLILMEPSRLGFFSMLRDKISGPGKRVFALDEIKYRMARADYTIDQIESLNAVEDMQRPAYFVRATKLENAAEPAPQFLTAKEMIERRKNKVPQGEELP